MSRICKAMVRCSSKHGLRSTKTPLAEVDARPSGIVVGKWIAELYAANNYQ